MAPQSGKKGQQSRWDGIKRPGPAAPQPAPIRPPDPQPPADPAGRPPGGSAPRPIHAPNRGPKN